MHPGKPEPATCSNDFKLHAARSRTAALARGFRDRIRQGLATRVGGRVRQRAWTAETAVEETPSAPATGSGGTAVDAAVVAIVGGGTHVAVGDAGLAQELRGACGDLVGRNHAAGAVDDAVVVIIAAHDVLGAAQERGKRFAAAAFASMGVQEDRPELGIGLQRRERAVGEDQHLLAFAHRLHAVAAGFAAGCRPPLRPLAVGVRGAVLQRANEVRIQCNEANGHLRSPMVSVAGESAGLRAPRRPETGSHRFRRRRLRPAAAGRGGPSCPRRRRRAAARPA